MLRAEGSKGPDDKIRADDVFHLFGVTTNYSLGLTIESPKDGGCGGWAWAMAPAAVADRRLFGSVIWLESPRRGTVALIAHPQFHGRAS
jgi:hypothetical protein